MRLPERRKRTEYKKPNRINSVTIGMVFMGLLLLYLGYCFWPVLSLRHRANEEMREVLLQVYHANLGGEVHAMRDVARIRKLLIERMRKGGIKDPKLEVKVVRNNKEVSLEARFKVTVTLLWLDKSYTIPVNPRVRTSAERVEW